MSVRKKVKKDVHAPHPGLRAVLVDDQGSRIRICPVGEPEPGVYAIDESQHFMDLGNVVKGVRISAGLRQTVWRGTTLSGKKVSGPTKGDAVALLLDADHFFQITLDDTIRPLF